MTTTEGCQGPNVSHLVGMNARLLRELHRMSQQDLAQHLGVFQTAVSNFEMGKRKVSVDELAILSKVFGVRPDLLLAPLDVCPDCNGAGLQLLDDTAPWPDPPSLTLCPRCNGNGWVGA